jgi:hypothetical protein
MLPRAFVSTGNSCVWSLELCLQSCVTVSLMDFTNGSMTTLHDNFLTARAVHFPYVPLPSQNNTTVSSMLVPVGYDSLLVVGVSTPFVSVCVCVLTRGLTLLAYCLTHPSFNHAPDSSRRICQRTRLKRRSTAAIRHGCKAPGA